MQNQKNEEYQDIIEQLHKVREYASVLEKHVSDLKAIA